MMKKITTMIRELYVININYFCYEKERQKIVIRFNCEMLKFVIKIKDSRRVIQNYVQKCKSLTTRNSHVTTANLAQFKRKLFVFIARLDKFNVGGKRA